MSARIPTFVTLLIVLSFAVQAAAIDLSQMNRTEQMQALLSAYNEKTEVAATALGDEGVPGTGIIQKCGLPLALQIRALENQYGTIAGFEDVMARPANLPLNFDSPGGHFKIHYTMTPGSRDTVHTRYGDNNSNGVPDYIDIVARIADSCWEHHINQLGFIEPIDDGTAGGDARYDVYVMNLDSRIYGSTVPDEEIVVGGSYKATSWMELDTKYEDYQGYSDRPIAALQVTVAHEFLHAIHLTYDSREVCTAPSCTPSNYNPYWLEMSAVWMEEEMYDGVNDYYNYLGYYLPTVHKAPYYISDDGLSIYGAALFPIFLAEKYGKEVNRIAWEYCGATTGENFFSGAIQSALADHTGGTVNLEQAWTEYSRWLFFTGTRARTGRYFPEAASYGMVPDEFSNPTRAYIRYYSEYPVTTAESGDNQFLPSELGINYLVFRTGSLASGFVLDFTGIVSTNPSTEWRKSVIAYDRFNANGLFRVSDIVYPLNTQVQVEDLDAITDVLVIPTIVNTDLRRLSNSYRFSVADTSVQISENKVLFANTKLIASDAVDRPLTVIFDVVQTSDVDISVYTVAGERVYKSERLTVNPGDPYSFTWNAKNGSDELVASGIYVVQARIGDEIRHQKILVVR